ncbi:MAG: hypothetical protein N3G20_07110, partial [Verrucomicrobiae bacterium]|nr:hypothetical protein [Verrucomicrobiae bacterium]
GNYANGSYDVGTGGGIYIKDIVGGRVSGCIVRGNVGQSSGGGMRLDQCGSATYPLVVENCTIIGNRTVSRDWTGGSVAGGIYFTRGGGDGTGRGFVVIANSLIQNNRAGTGSGIYASSYQANARLTIFGSLITGNYSLLNNGNANGIFAGTDFITIVANSTIADNTHPTQPGQYGIYAQYGGWGLYGRIVFINSIMASNNKGMYDFRQSRSYGAAGAHIDLLRSTTYETEYLQRDEGPYGGPYPNVTNQTASTWSGALAFTNPGYHSRNDSGTVTQNMEQNLNESPGFSGKSPAPYSLVPSSNSRNSGLTLTGAGFTYVDVNYNGAYNAMVDIIVAGTPPAGRHLVYTTDLLGMPRVSDNVIDRGAYEYRPPRGTVVVVR